MRTTSVMKSDHLLVKQVEAEEQPFRLFVEKEVADLLRDGLFLAWSRYGLAKQVAEAKTFDLVVVSALMVSLGSCRRESQLHWLCCHSSFS